jgi:hypothetical protein
MRATTFLLCALAFVVGALVSCAGDDARQRPVIPPPVATAGGSAAQEDLISQKASHDAQEQLAKEQSKSFSLQISSLMKTLADASTDGQRQAVEAQLKAALQGKADANTRADTEKAAKEASQHALADQQNTDLVAQQHEFIGAGVLTIALSALIWRLTGSTKDALYVAAPGGALIVMGLFIISILPLLHYLPLATLAGATAATLYHYRLRVLADAVKLKNYALALEHTVAHSGFVAHSVAEVETLIAAAWRKVRGLAQEGLVAAHLVKVASVPVSSLATNGVVTLAATAPLPLTPAQQALANAGAALTSH